METKMLEIRDKATFIPALAINMQNKNNLPSEEQYLLRRAGFGRDYPCIELVYISADRCAYDPYVWTGSRTLVVAHQWIVEHWNEVKSGDVIDVEWILGETKEIKKSERLE